MPHVNIWIRKEDWAAWEAIKDKPEWLHEMLSLPKNVKPWSKRELEILDAFESTSKNVAPRAKPKEFDLNRVASEVEEHYNKKIKVVTNPRFDKGLCKIHGLPLDARGRCLQKGCKYS